MFKPFKKKDLFYETKVYPRRNIEDKYGTMLQIVTNRKQYHDFNKNQS